MAKNNPKPTEEDFCIVCGHNFAETHEPIMGTFGRQKSIEYGLQVKLCIEHHRTGKFSAHKDAEFNKHLQALMEIKFEEEYPELDFYNIFGKYYKHNLNIEKYGVIK